MRTILITFVLCLFTELLFSQEELTRKERREIIRNATREEQWEIYRNSQLNDSSDIDQINVYKNKAVKMRNTGIYLTCTGVGIVATGFIITGIKKKNVTDPNDNMEEIADAIPSVLGSIVGVPVTIAGLTLSSIGANRKTKAELALKKFDIKPANSMALGVGVTLRF